MAKVKRKSGLGRGLSAILPDSVDDPNANPVEVATGIGQIPITQIEMTNTYQPRTEFEKEALEELADSIKVHGIIQPLTVRRLEPGKYQLIAGERRMRAAKMVGLKEVPAHIRKANDEQMLEMALIENIQRVDLNPIEIALTYQRMIDELGLKHDELGGKVGKKRETVTNYLRLLKLPEEVIKAVRVGKISMGHAKALMGIKDKKQQSEALSKVLAEELSVRQTESIAKASKNPKTAPSSGSTSSASTPSSHQILLKKLERQLEEKFDNKVRIRQESSGNGEITLHFHSTEDLNRILEILDL